jgi:hypothetical protein
MLQNIQLLEYEWSKTGAMNLNLIKIILNWMKNICKKKIWYWNLYVGNKLDSKVNYMKWNFPEAGSTPPWFSNNLTLTKGNFY